jgi:hypothetical protein
MAHRQKFPNFELEKTNGKLEIHKMSRRDLTKKELDEGIRIQRKSNCDSYSFLDLAFGVTPIYTPIFSLVTPSLLGLHRLTVAEAP